MEDFEKLAHYIVALLLFFVSAAVITSLHTNAVPQNYTITIPPIPVNTYPIKIVSITPTSLIVGDSLDFVVVLSNTGSAPIYYVGGCYGPLSFAVSPSSAVSTEDVVRCQAFTAVRLNASSTAVITTDSHTRIASTGEVVVGFTFSWAPSRDGVSPVYGPNYTAFSSDFGFH